LCKFSGTADYLHTAYNILPMATYEFEGHLGKAIAWFIEVSQDGGFMRSKLRGLVLIGSILLLGITLPASADSITLRDGRHVRGKFAGGTQGVIAFSISGDMQYYDVKDVLVMTFGEDEGSLEPQHASPVLPGNGSIVQQKMQKKSPTPKLKRIAL
jgi:hypothetical protein